MQAVSIYAGAIVTAAMIASADQRPRAVDRILGWAAQLHGLLKPGPVWRGGYIYMMHASICRTDAATVQAADIAYVLGSLQTRIYDPLGNLRNANDPTTYGPAGDQQRRGQ
jgi:hypothetical protein